MTGKLDLIADKVAVLTRMFVNLQVYRENDRYFPFLIPKC